MAKPEGGARALLVKLVSYSILIFFVALCVYFNVRLGGRFLSADNIVNILQQTAINTVIAVGMTFVIISGGIDLSVGAVLGVAGVLSMAALKRADVTMQVEAAILIAAIVGITAGGLAGALNGIFITRFRVTPFIATLGMMGLAQGYGFVFTNAVPIFDLPKAFTDVIGSPSIKMGSLPSIPPLVPLALLVVAAGYVLLTRTSFGRKVYAVGGNQEAARLSGVNVNRTKMGVYIISGLLAGLSGFMFAAYVQAGDPKSGQMYEMNAIAAVVLGGTSLMGGVGSVMGTLLGALVIGSLKIGLDQVGVSPYYQMMVKGGVILLAVVLDQLKVRLTAQAK